MVNCFLIMVFLPIEMPTKIFCTYFMFYIGLIAIGVYVYRSLYLRKIFLGNCMIMQGMLRLLGCFPEARHLDNP